MRARGLSAILLAGLAAAGAPVMAGDLLDASPPASPEDTVRVVQAADTLAVGERAPDFVIPSTVGIPEEAGTVRLRAIAESGRSVVLAFFPKAFTGG